METLNNKKFQKLSQIELVKVNGGSKLESYTACAYIGTGDKPVSISVYSYNWFERNLLGHEATEEKYDTASC